MAFGSGHLLRKALTKRPTGHKSSTPLGHLGAARKSVLRQNFSAGRLTGST